MDKTSSPSPAEVVETAEVVARETLTVGGENKKPGSILNFPAAEAKRLVDAGAAAWPEDGAVVAAKRPAGRDLLAAIGQAMRAIDPAEGVTPEGKASLYALRHHLGFEVTAEERDAAHDMFEGRRDLFASREGMGAGEAAARAIALVKSHDFGDPLLNAIRDLDPSSPANWTQEGKPDARALSEAVKRNVSANERDEAWDRYGKAATALMEKQ